MPKPLPEPGRKKSGTLVGSQSADQIHRSISPPADEAPSSPVSLTKSVRAVKEVQKARTNAANTRRRKRNSAAEWANPQAAKKDAAAAAPAPPKSAETKAALRAALKQTEPFAELEGTQQLLALIDAMVKVDVKAGAVLVKEGADGIAAEAPAQDPRQESPLQVRPGPGELGLRRPRRQAVHRSDVLGQKAERTGPIGGAPAEDPPNRVILNPAPLPWN